MERNNPKDTHRICTICKQSKPITEFSYHKCMSDGVRSDCKACGVKRSMDYNKRHPEKKKVKDKRYRTKHNAKVNAMTRKWRKNNPEIVRKHNLKKYFGLTVEVYDSMYIEQGGCCAICGTHQSELKLRLAVDHDHETGQLRGLLCGSCNTALGLMKDSIGILDNAVSYLERSIIADGIK